MSLGKTSLNNSSSFQTPVIDDSFRKCYCGQCLNNSAGDSPASSKICDCVTDSSKLKQNPKTKSKIPVAITCNKERTRFSKPNKKVLWNEVDWYRHLAKLERLAKPVEPCCLMCPPERGAKVPLKKLCPRIKALSMPRNPLKKRQYVKDPDEVPLPGAVKDWPKHCRWLDKNSQPKMYYDPECDKPRRRKGPKLHRLKRTLWLAEPKNPREKVTCHDDSLSNPITKVSSAAKNYCASENILKLSEPKPFIVGRVYQEHVPDFCLTFVSPKALKYKATTRIKQLACPKRFCMWQCFPHMYINPSSNCKPCGCIDCNHLNHLAKPKLCWVQPKDYRHVRFLSTYKIGNKCCQQNID